MEEIPAYTGLSDSYRYGRIRPMSQAEKIAAKQTKDVQQLEIKRPKRAKLSEEETLKRMEAFDERKEQFVASIRKSKS
jgi:hypothetical protein